MRRESTTVPHGWGGSPAERGTTGPRQRGEELLDRCLKSVADIRTGEVRLLDAVVALRSEIDHQLFGQDGPSPSVSTPACRAADTDAATVDEFATASGMSRLYTYGLVRLAGTVPALLARGRDALAEGRVELHRVIDWHEATSHLAQDDALAVGDSVLTPRRDGTPRSASDFRRLLSKRVKQAEATDREARRRATDEALSRRGSWSSPGDAGTGSLTVTGEATRVAAAHARLDAAARRAKAFGDDRSLSQLRSDLHLDLLLVGQLPNTALPTNAAPHTRAGETPLGNPPGAPTAPPVRQTPAVPAPLGGHPPTQDLPAAPDAAPTAPQTPLVCTSCGAVSDDYLPYPTVGDPVLPPAHCTVVVGLDVLLEDACTPQGVGTAPQRAGVTAGDDSDSRAGPPTREDPITRAGAITRESPATGEGPERSSDPPSQADTPPARSSAGGRGSALGWMPGFGYLDPDHVRQLAVREGSVWQRLVADPVSGHAVSVSPFSYRPTASVARFVRARDGVVRDPGSGSFGATAAGQCEIDHIVPFEAGGTTTPDNLQALSRRGHTRKTQAPVGGHR